MHQRRFGIAAITSLSLLAMLVALLVRSFFRIDALTYFGDGSNIGVLSLTDRLMFARRHGPGSPRHGWRWQSYDASEYLPSGGVTDFIRQGLFGEQYSVSILGFGFGNGQRMGDRVAGVWLPMWFPILLTLIAPMMWVRRRFRHASRRAAGRCIHCGYDIRESESACPECGASLA